MTSMKRNLSEQLLDGMKDATLGPNQRMSGQADAVGAAPRKARDPQQRPLLGLLSNIAALSVIVSFLIVNLSSTTASELPQLLIDVVTFKRGEESISALLGSSHASKTLASAWLTQSVCAQFRGRRRTTSPRSWRG